MQYSIIAFQVKSALVIATDASTGKSTLLLQRNIHNDKITTAGTFQHNDTTYFYTGSFDKLIKFWVLPSETENLSLVNSCVLQKKITHSFYLNGEHFVTDKYGDIYSFSIDNILRSEADLYPEYQNSNNLAIQQAFEGVSHADRSYCLLGDSYSKIKLFDLKEMHDLVNFWVPFESHLISILEFTSQIVLLFQMKDSETLEKRFALHTFNKDNILNTDYLGKPIEGITFEDDLNKVRITKSSNSTAGEAFVIYSVTRKGALRIQEYSLTEQKVLRNEAQQLSLELQANEKLYLSVSTLPSTTLAVVGVKEAVTEDQSLSEAIIESAATATPKVATIVARHEAVTF